MFFIILAIITINWKVCANTKLGWSSFHSAPNNEIDSRTRLKIHKLNKLIAESIKKNDTSKMYNFLTKSAKEQGKKHFSTVFNQLHQLVKESEFVQFYDNLIEVEVRGEQTINIPSETSIPFFIQLSVKGNSILKKEQHKYFFSQMHTIDNYIERMLTFVYKIEANKWKLHIFHMGDFKIGKKTSVEWFEEAISISKNGHPIPAILRQKYVNKVLRPAPFVQYEIEPNITSFFKNQANTVKKDLELPIEHPNDPRNKIFGIDGIIVNQKLLPILNFTTKLAISNDSDLRREALTLARIAKDKIPGIFEYNEEFLMRAYKELPIYQGKEYKYFGIIFKSNEIE